MNGVFVSPEASGKFFITATIIIILLLIAGGIASQLNLLAFINVKNTKPYVHWIPIINCCRCNLTVEQANKVSGMLEWDDCYMIQGNMRNLSARIFVNISGVEGVALRDAEDSFTRMLSRVRIHEFNETYREIIVIKKKT